jgi:hypothetical protein
VRLLTAAARTGAGAVYGALMRRLTVVSAAVVVAAAVWLIPTISTAAEPVNYCQVIPIVNVPPQGWGFHAGHPVSGATGAYTRGHGTIDLRAKTATGVICQVYRPRGKADREVVLTVGRHVLHASHHAVRFGVPGNIMTVPVRVRSSTDHGCKVGSEGRVTIFASYNNVHRDGVRLTFAGSCRDQRRHWSGPSVITNVPPN